MPKPIKMLLLGNSGAGKTALLATLAKDYQIYLADFDNGAEILDDPGVVPAQHRKNVHVWTFYDRATLLATGPMPTAQSYTQFVQALGNWKGKGDIYKWGANDVLVIDSLSFLGNVCMNYAQMLSKRLGQKPQIQEFGAAMDAVESIVETLYNPAVQCNVIFTAHLEMKGDPLAGGAQKMIPLVLGNKLAPKIPRYFNNVLMIEKVVQNGKFSSKLHTVGTFNLDLKTSRPSKVPTIIEPADLSKFFSFLQQEEPTTTPATAPALEGKPNEAQVAQVISLNENTKEKAS